MKKLLPIYLLLLSGFASMPCFAQGAAAEITRDTLYWKMTKVIVREDSTEVRFPCTFITQGSQHVDMFIGSLHHQFTVQEVEGTWTDLTANGTITYFLDEERNRFMIITRSESGLIITIDFTAAGGLLSVFTIETVTPAESL